MAARKNPDALRKSGGPKPDKEWRDALRLELHTIVADPASGERAKALRLIAAKVVSMAINGDMRAISEIGDRLDGRPHASVAVSAPAECADMSESELIAIARGFSQAAEKKSEHAAAAVAQNSVH